MVIEHFLVIVAAIIFVVGIFGGYAVWLSRRLHLPSQHRHHSSDGESSRGSAISDPDHRASFHRWETEFGDDEDPPASNAA